MTPNEKIIKIVLPTPFAVGDVNVYVLKGDAVTLIDAGVKTEAAWEAFTFQLAQYGLTPEDINQVVLTHHHPDHVGFLEWLPEVPIYGHKYVRPWIEEDQAFFAAHDDFYRRIFKEFGLRGDFEKMLHILKSPLKYSSGAPLAQEIAEGDKIPGLEKWSILETPGHAQSHLSFYLENDGVLLSGDHLLATISSNPFLEPALEPASERPKPQLQYNESLGKLLDIDIRIAYTGHGADIQRVHELVKRRLHRQHERALQVLEMLKAERLTTFSITKELFPAVYQKELGLTLSESTAQLDYLLSLGLIDKQIDDDGVAFFFAIKEVA
ncbi:MBL fold metallo-hydrolase [Lederbergia panacisoli]|uniref:MBL fold metallo-hydrolase n=1 Tax=Lederbergia panacisoli TaxID=1255251 RepID=UPI00214C40A6|nr:MBL fold metallo-hydrolase [Lederbergia panacisoli]MCR2820316.1 MBL fold metallo-hydrolase [Lederbergia panacisoli]